MVIGLNARKNVQELYKNGMQKTAIARKLGISVSTVYNVLNACKNVQLQGNADKQGNAGKNIQLQENTSNNVEIHANTGKNKHKDEEKPEPEITETPPTREPEEVTKADLGLAPKEKLTEEISQEGEEEESAEEEKYLCSNCGSEIEGTPDNCPYCGEEFEDVEE